MDAAVLDELRGRIRALESGGPRQEVPVLPALQGLVRMRTGASYEVDTPSVAMALAAGASSAGEWVGFVGWEDFGAEAAHQLGVDLARTVLVPAPGEHWVEVVAALVDVLRVVVLRPAGRIDAKSASVLDARLRTRSATLVVQGAWPRSEARIAATDVTWDGLGSGSGRLRGQRLRVAVHDTGRPTVRDVVLPYASGAVAEVPGGPGGERAGGAAPGVVGRVG